MLRTVQAGDATRWARESDADIVVAVGGDGTVSEVATGLLGTEKAIGILPCG
ncbi:MAG: NAD(+)/NADH kinase, partial [Bacteroidales bacterium]|nr:NAD(+)/NADH kinase [Bacteroidales bacterium]